MKKPSWLLPLLTILGAAALLYGLSAGLSGVTRENARTELTEKMQTILPGSTTFTEEEYTGEDVNIRGVWAGETGFVIQTTTAGYAGDVTMLIGVSKDGRVTGLQVRSMEETFGLGAEALTDEAFLAQFLNTAGDVQIGSGVDALTGATVTSRAIARSVNSAVGYVTGADTSSGATSWGG